MIRFFRIYDPISFRISYCPADGELEKGSLSEILKFGYGDDDDWNIYISTLLFENIKMLDDCSASSRAAHIIPAPAKLNMRIHLRRGERG